jgi:hypothetical protein
MTGSAPTNNAAVDFEKQQAAEADAKEAARQARLTQGQQLIDQIFNGQPVMGTRTLNYDWSSFNPVLTGRDPNTGQTIYSGANVPAGFSVVNAPAQAATGAPTAARRSPTVIGAQPRVSGTLASTPVGGARPSSVMALQGPDGKIYNKGDPLSITSTYDTGQRTGGFDDAFFNNYRQKVLDYYQPDEQRQYDAAQRDLKYGLARAGTLQSSTAADKQGELAYQDAQQRANIVANANTQEGNLKSQIQQNKQALINQLYSTEDPTLTANLAQSSAAASRLQDPTLTPAASLFTPALTTVGSAVNGMLYPGQTYNSPFNTAASSPTPTSASESRGKTYTS